MPLTPEEEQEYQRLGTKLGFLGNAGAAPPEDDYGAWGFAGRTAANILPGALEKIIQPAQTLLGMGDEMSSIPNFFDVRPPRNIKEHIIGGAGEIAEYLPAIIGTEGAAATGLARLGMAAPRVAEAALIPSRAARIAASGIGQALPMAPHGAETAGVQGGVGALQRAAMDWGWRGKVAAGLLGAGAGYYEGSKGPEGTPTQGAVFAGLNLLGPTVIDPIVNKLTGYKPYAPGGQPIPGQSAIPATEAFLGPEGHIDAAFQQMNPAQRQAYIEAVMGRSGPAPFVPEPFKPVQTTDGTFRNPIDVGQLNTSGPNWRANADLNWRTTGGGMNWMSDIGLPVSSYPEHAPFPGENAYDIFAGLQRQPQMGPLDILTPGERAHFASEDRTVQGSPLTVAEASQKRLLRDRRAALTSNEQAAFTRSLTNRAAGVQQDIHALFPFGLDPVRPFDPVMSISEHVGTSSDIYGGQLGVFDIMGQTRPPAPSQAALTPAETAARAQFLAKKQAVVSPPPAKPTARAAAAPKAPAKTITEGKASALQNIRPAIDVGDRRIIGEIGDTHQDILNKHLAANPDDADALLNFDSPENPNYFIDKGGNRISREQLQKTYGIRDSQGLRDKQKGLPPKSEPVEPAPAKPAAEPAPDARPRVQIKGRYGWEEAVIIGKEGDVLHVQTLGTDPIFGVRTTSVLETDTLPVASLQKAEPVKPAITENVPFKDIKSTPLTRKDQIKEMRWGNEEETSLGSMIEGSGPAKVSKTLPGRDKTILSIEEGLKLLPDEPRAILSEILHQAQVAVGRELDIHFERGAKGSKGSMYIDSGRIGVNLHWINGIVQNWSKMSADSQVKALMKATALFGHEITHVVHRYAEKSGLAINGMGVTAAIVHEVESMSPSQRKYVAEQILKAKGEGNVSERVINYLSGDYDQIHEWYSKRRGREMTPEETKQLAAGEVMAEIGSIELVKRMNVSGLPQGFRDIVDKFKQVLINVVHWFTSQGHNSEIAALQNLQSIASKMYDHFAIADEVGLAKAFPTSVSWKTPPVVNPFSSGAPPPGTTGSTVPTAPAVDIVNGPLLKNELLRLGVRGAVGATIGAYAGPALAPNQVTTAEGIILGGIAGIFGPAVVKKLLSGNFAEEAAAALKAHPKNPLKALGYIMGGGKTLQELGIEGRHGWTGQSSSMAKWVRWFEHEFDLGLDPAQKAISEEARGLGSEQLAIVSDALDKVRWYKPNPTMIDAVNSYFEGKITKTDFKALLTSPQLQNYGNFIMAAREGMTTLSKMFASGLPRSAFKQHVIDTSEKYLGKFYSAYTEGKFNMEHFDKAKQDLMQKYGYSDQIADELLHEYMREVQSNRKMYSTGRRGESGEKYDTSTLMRRMATEEEIEGQMVIVGGFEHNKFGKDYQKEFAKLEWMQAHKITDNWRLWLGEYTNPVERMMYTFQKIHPSAISGHAFDLLDSRVHTNGNKFSYTDKELVSTRTLLESEIQSGKYAGEELAGLQNRLKELSGYGPVPEGAAYGKLRGKWVDRFTRDSLNTYSTPYKWMEQPIIRSLAEFNNLIKVAHTALTPLTVWRNYLSMPFMGLISRANWGDVAGAFKEIHFNKGNDYRLMLRRHIIGGDFSTQELSKGPGTVFSGYMDSDIATKAGKSLWRLILKNYQQPDMLVRAGAFISARKRFAAELLETGIQTVDENQVASHYRPANLIEAMDHATVIDKAVEFTNRYTMNYATVPNIVKAGRQLPFINMFISYTSEMTRILKNLTEDVIAPGPNSAGRMHAITTLGAMAAIPTIMTQMGLDQLSEKDQADWKRVEKLSPRYNRSRFRIPYSRDAQGRFHYFDITNLLPADNYSQMIKAFSQGDSEAFWAANPLVSLQNTPLLNMATEQITGEDIHTGQTIQGFGRVREILKEVLPPIIPPGYEGQRLVRAFSTNVEGEAGLTNMKTGVQYRPSDIVSNYITGMRFGNVMLSTIQRQAIAEAKQQIAEQQQLLRDTTNMNVGPSQRARAQEIYNKSVEQIMFKLHEKMPAPK